LERKDPITAALAAKEQRERDGFCFDCETERATTTVFDFYKGRTVHLCADCRALNYEKLRPSG
jgi:hypothetical protein